MVNHILWNGMNVKASPRIRFNKDGTLLVVFANENGIKIVANSDGLRLLRTFENLSFDSSRATENLTQNGEARTMGDVKPRIVDEANDKSKIWKLTEISDSSQCRYLKLPENMRVTEKEEKARETPLVRHANIKTIPNQHRTDEDLTTYSRSTFHEHHMQQKPSGGWRNMPLERMLCLALVW